MLRLKKEQLSTIVQFGTNLASQIFVEIVELFWSLCVDRKKSLL